MGNIPIFRISGFTGFAVFFCGIPAIFLFIKMRDIYVPIKSTLILTFFIKYIFELLVHLIKYSWTLILSEIIKSYISLFHWEGVGE